jgi:hypothetical protein
MAGATQAGTTMNTIATILNPRVTGQLMRNQEYARGLQEREQQEGAQKELGRMNPLLAPMAGMDAGRQSPAMNSFQTLGGKTMPGRAASPLMDLQNQRAVGGRVDQRDSLINKAFPAQAQASLLDELFPKKVDPKDRYGNAEGIGVVDYYAEGGPKTVLETVPEILRPGVVDARARVAREGRSNVTVQNLPQAIENKWQLGATDTDVEMRKKALERAEQAAGQLSNIEQYQAAADSGRFRQGPFAGQRAFVGDLLAFAGMDPNQVPALGDPAAYDALDQASKNVALNFLSLQEGLRGTNLALRLTQDSVMDASRSPTGNKVISEVMKAASEQIIKEADIWNTYARKSSAFPEGEPDAYEAINRSRREFDKRVGPMVTTILEEAREAPKSWEQLLGSSLPSPDSTGSSGVDENLLNKYAPR